MTENLTLDTLLGRLAREELPWDKAWSASFAAFAERFTLHDSAWVGVFLNVREDAEAILAFHWDPHWLPEPLAALCREAERGWDGWAKGLPFLLLFIRVAKVESISLSGYDEPTGGRAVGDAQAYAQNGGEVIEIKDFMGATTSITHQGTLEFLPLLYDGRVLDMAQVLPRDPVPPSMPRPWWKLW